MLIPGLAAGLVAAAGQAFSYLLSRRFVLATGGTPLRLLALAHVWMGLAALLLLPAFWPRAPLDVELLLRLGHFLISYLTAQYCFFWTVRHGPPSRVAPLMGLKVAVVAVIVALCGLDRLGSLHWTAVALTVLASFAVGSVGERLSWRAWLGILATISAFASSDVSIQRLIAHLTGHGTPRPAFAAAALTYACCLPVGVALMLMRGSPDRTEGRTSLAYSLAWFSAMLGLYLAIDLVGVVIAIMMQSLRGPCTIVFAALWPGAAGIEQVFGRRSLILQLLAALLMVAATALYAAADWWQTP